jgi:Secretion system C-terminal sorting domain
MKNLILVIFSIFSYFFSFAQPSVPFSNCPNEQIIVYKDGTNCTESPYSFYTMDLGGNLLATIGSPTPAGVEINAISISNIDKFVYALRYDRIGTTSPCTFANTHFIRMDAAGTIADLGTITPPVGGTITTALGTISSNGNYVFLATVGSNIYLGVISSVVTLPTAGTISATYYPITNSCPGKSIADWAINPTDGNLYGYATFPETVLGTTYMRGTVIKIDFATKIYTCVGAVNTTEFLDPARDNFGGVMFASDNFLYGVNINTRKFYKIDVLTGIITYISTFPGSGNMRADLGSCVSAAIVLPIKLSSFSVNNSNCKNFLNWKLEDASIVKSISILQSFDGVNYKEIKFYSNGITNNFELPISSNCFYKLKFIENNGTIFYSDAKFVKNNCNESLKLKIANNPIKNELIAYYKFESKKIQVEIIDVLGKKINFNSVNYDLANSKISIDVSNLAIGFYFLKMTNEKGEVEVKSFTKQ